MWTMKCVHFLVVKSLVFAGSGLCSNPDREGKNKKKTQVNQSRNVTLKKNVLLKSN